MKADEVAEAINCALVSSYEEDTHGECANAVDALFHLSRSIRNGLSDLGNGNAGTSMGALEAHGKAMMDSADKISAGLHDIAEAIRESGRLIS